jgi:hypothetical protein
MQKAEDANEPLRRVLLLDDAPMPTALIQLGAEPTENMSDATAVVVQGPVAALAARLIDEDVPDRVPGWALAEWYGWAEGVRAVLDGAPDDLVVIARETLRSDPEAALRRLCDIWGAEMPEDLPEVLPEGLPEDLRASGFDTTLPLGIAELVLATDPDALALARWLAARVGLAPPGTGPATAVAQWHALNEAALRGRMETAVAMADAAAAQRRGAGLKARGAAREAALARALLDGAAREQELTLQCDRFHKAPFWQWPKLRRGLRRGLRRQEGGS